MDGWLALVTIVFLLCATGVAVTVLIIRGEK